MPKLLLPILMAVMLAGPAFADDSEYWTPIRLEYWTPTTEDFFWLMTTIEKAGFECRDFNFDSTKALRAEGKRITGYNVICDNFSPWDGYADVQSFTIEYFEKGRDLFLRRGRSLVRDHSRQGPRSSMRRCASIQVPVK